MSINLKPVKWASNENASINPQISCSASGGKSLKLFPTEDTKSPGEANKDNTGNSGMETGNDVGGGPFKKYDEEDTRNWWKEKVL